MVRFSVRNMQTAMMIYVACVAPCSLTLIRMLSEEQNTTTECSVVSQFASADECQNEYQ